MNPSDLKVENKNGFFLINLKPELSVYFDQNGCITIVDCIQVQGIILLGCFKLRFYRTRTINVKLFVGLWVIEISVPTV